MQQGLLLGGLFCEALAQHAADHLMHPQPSVLLVAGQQRRVVSQARQLLGGIVALGDRSAQLGPENICD